MLNSEYLEVIRMNLYVYLNLTQYRNQITPLREEHAGLTQNQVARERFLVHLRALEPTLHQVLPALAQITDLSERIAYLRHAVIASGRAAHNVDQVSSERTLAELTRLEETSLASRNLVALNEQILETSQACLAALRVRALMQDLTNPEHLLAWRGW